MQRSVLAGWFPPLALLALGALCFARLAAHPSALIVDAVKPSIDRANRAGPRPVGNDLVNYVLPQYLSITRTIERFGHFPLWDTRGFGGRPLCGNPQSGLFYPPVWAAWWLRSPAAPGWLTVAHLVSAGLGAYRLSRFLGAGRIAATVAAGTYQASPYLLAHTFEGHYPHVWSACWYPWAFWSCAQWRAGRKGGAVFLPVFLALAYLTGHPQEWLLLVLALATWSFIDIFKALRDHGAGRAVREALWRGAALALSLGIAAVEIAPEWAVRPWLLYNRLRSSGLAMPRRYHLSALNGIQLLSPTALGGPADYFGDDNYWETVFSVGFVPLVLAAIAVLRHGQRRLVWGWLVLAGFAVWFACGRNLGLYALLYATIPGMSWFRVPARSLFLAALGVAVLAGMGIDTLHRELADLVSWRRYARRFAAVMLAGLVLLLVLQAQRGSPLSPPRTARAATRVLHDPRFWLCVGGLTVLSAMGCLGPGQGERWRRSAGAFAGLLAFVELGWAGYALIRVAPADLFIGPEPIGTTINRLANLHADNVPARIKARDTFYDDLRAIAAGLEKTNINDVFQLDHAARLYEMLYRPTARPRPHEAGLLMREPVNHFERGVRQAIFDRMSVGYLVSDRFEPDPGWPVIARGQVGALCYVIARNPTTLPRAYVVPAVTVAKEPPPSILSLFRGLDPRQSVVTDHDPLAEVPTGPRQRFTPAQWASLDPDRPILNVATQAPGLLVVADTWMPGWTARVDGQIVPILRGNVAQRVIPILHPGAHTIAMSYRPPGLVLGIWVMSGSLLAWLAVAGSSLLTKYLSHSGASSTMTTLPPSRLRAAAARCSVRYRITVIR
ncbi:MAG: hypothetical protein ACLQVF_21570 [Isosphaeraceae bacterium]